MEVGAKVCDLTEDLLWFVCGLYVGILMSSLICSNDKFSTKRAHSGCTPQKTVHPAAEMCTPGAGCTLNFGY